MKQPAKILIVAVIATGTIFLNGCSRAYRYERVTVTNNSLLPSPININSASADELEKLPHIGETLARRIVEFREQNGPFRRPENLLLVEGISENRFKEIRPLVK